jgi:hypothetical protein
MKLFPSSFFFFSAQVPARLYSRKALTAPRRSIDCSVLVIDQKHHRRGVMPVVSLMQMLAACLYTHKPKQCR